MRLPFLLAGEPPAPGQEILWVFNHALDGPAWAGAPITRMHVMIALTAVVVTLMALAIKRSLSRDPMVPRGFMRNSLESLVVFIRDEFVRPTMGAHHGDRFVPFFCTVFLFILLMNLLGMVAIPQVGATATSNLNVTLALATIVLVTSTVSGFAFHGPGGFLKLFVPSGLPVALVPLLFVLELVGYFIKHAVLSIRLLANMLAGHLVIGAFLGLIFVFKSYAISPVSILMALFISCLELLVAFLQAYVFTLLASLFIGGMVHPDH